ncbi:MAG: response regulator [Planctomycetota bacterium]|jgi:DNA-binding NarL/FixJ family response regulator
MSNEQNQHSNSESEIRILIVDDHPIVRRGLVQLINQEPGFKVCAEADDAEQALKVIGSQHLDLAVVDISLSGTNGVQLTAKIKSQYPDLPVLILTMHDELRYAELAFQAGAKGYVTKHEAAETIIGAIHLVLAGKKFVSKRVNAKFADNCVQQGTA